MKLLLLLQLRLRAASLSLLPVELLKVRQRGKRNRKDE